MKLRWKIDKIKAPRITRETGLALGAAALGLALMYAGSSASGGGTGGDPGGGTGGGGTGTWTPKWHVGDIISSTKLPSARWTIRAILYYVPSSGLTGPSGYDCWLDFAGRTAVQVIPGSKLETPDMYKVS